MRHVNGIAVGARIWALALATVLVPAALAQIPAAAPTARHDVPDMRLWSFGDCDNHFPYVNSDEHKECVRVVGSPEAKDARAFRICETSHSRDPEEVARCKSAYTQNKQKATQSSIAAREGVLTEEQVPPEVLAKVRALASAAVERDRAAAAERGNTAAAEPKEPEVHLAPAIEEPTELGSLPMIIGVVSLVMLALGVVSTRARRNQGA
jgi:hypothetical protein